jgi:hypothetical protein
VLNAPLRRSGAMCAATAAADAGSAHPLAAPNKNLLATTATIGACIIVHNGVAATASDQNAKPANNTFAPPYVSLAAPAASCVTPYPHKNELCASATSFIVIPSSALMLSAAAAKMVLSALASNMATPSAMTMTRASAPDATFRAGTASALSPEVARVVVVVVAFRDETRG